MMERMFKINLTDTTRGTIEEISRNTVMSDKIEHYLAQRCLLAKILNLFEKFNKCQ